MPKIKFAALLVMVMAVTLAAPAQAAPRTKTCANGAVVRLSQTCPAPAPAPAPAPTPPPVPGIPAGYTVVPIPGLKCDGVSDDTLALQAAMNAARAYQALALPSGRCLYGAVLRLGAKANVALIGAGQGATVLQAKDPLHSSLIVTGSSAVLLQGFQIVSPNASARTSDAASRGVYVERSSNVTVDGVKVGRVAGAGMLFFVVNGATVRNSLVDGSLADAFHFTGGSSNVLAQGNTALNAGDDCFASIGYGTAINTGVQFLDNVCSDNHASGVSFEGTTGGKAYRNHLTRTGVAGIRIASIASWNTGAVDQIDVRGNVLDDVKTRTDIDHAAIMVFSGLASVTNVTLSGNTVTNPRTAVGVKVLNYVPATATVSASVTGTAFSGTTIKQCVGALNDNPSASGNTLNGVAC